MESTCLQDKICATEVAPDLLNVTHGILLRCFKRTCDDFLQFEGELYDKQE